MVRATEIISSLLDFSSFRDPTQKCREREWSCNWALCSDRENPETCNQKECISDSFCAHLIDNYNTGGVGVLEHVVADVTQKGTCLRVATFPEDISVRSVEDVSKLRRSGTFGHRWRAEHSRKSLKLVSYH